MTRNAGLEQQAQMLAATPIEHKIYRTLDTLT